MSKNIVITGATSFIGQSLLEKLTKLNKYNIYAIVRPNSSNISKLDKFRDLNIIELEMSDIGDLTNYLDKCDIFFHLAWDGTRGSTRDDKKLQIGNYKNSKKALEVACKLKCKTFIEAGSQAEFGVYNHQINEETKCKPLTEYGKAKLKFFNFAQDFCKKNDIHFKEPRFFSLYGPGDYPDTLIISTINKMLSNTKIELTQCIQMWNFLYLDDAVDGIIRLATKDCQDGSYCFGSDDTRVLKDYIDELYKITGTKSELVFGAIPYHKSGMVSIQPDITKLLSTGWKQKTSFRKGVLAIICDIKGEIK